MKIHEIYKFCKIDLYATLMLTRDTVECLFMTFANKFKVVLFEYEIYNALHCKHV